MTLPEELVEEIVLRFPPEEPASLVRAALVCKLWRRLVCSPVFGHKFREFHRAAAHVLGMLCQAESYPDGESSGTAMAHFVPAAAASAVFRPARTVHHDCRRVVDARHGRVLLQRATRCIHLFVWDPITDEQHHLPGLPSHPCLYASDWNAAVMCGRRSSSSRHHLDCTSSAFLVVFVKLEKDELSTCVYDSESGAWAERQVATSTTYLSELQQSHGYYDVGPGVLVADALHFMVHGVQSIGVLKYNLATKELCAIRLPLSRLNSGYHVLVATEDGRLGVAVLVDKTKLCLYCPSSPAAATGSDSTAAARFVLGRVIDLEKLLPADALRNPRCPPYLIDFNSADATGVVFVSSTSDGGLYSVDTKYGHAKRLPGCYNHYDEVVPYVSFHTPHASGGGIQDQEQTTDEAATCGKRKRSNKQITNACPEEARHGKRPKNANIMRLAVPEWANKLRKSVVQILAAMYE